MMKFEIEIDENGQITLKEENEVILISRHMSRVLDVIEDMAANNGESTLLKPNIKSFSKFLELYDDKS